MNCPMNVVLREDQPLLSVQLSNGQSAVFSQKHIMEHLGVGVWVDVGGDGKTEQSRLLIQFDCVFGNESAKKGGKSRTARQNFFIAVIISLWGVFLAIVAFSFLGSNFVEVSNLQQHSPFPDLEIINSLANVKDEAWNLVRPASGIQKLAVDASTANDAGETVTVLWTTSTLVLGKKIGGSVTYVYSQVFVSSLRDVVILLV